jgi:hypothetical protein
MSHVALMRETRNAYINLVCKLESKRTLSSSRCSYQDNIKTDDMLYGTECDLHSNCLRKLFNGGLL